MENKFQMQQFTAYSTFEKYNYIILSYMKKTGKVNIACVCASNKNSEGKLIFKCNNTFQKYIKQYYVILHEENWQ